MSVELHHGDCLDMMPTLPDHSFDAIIADLPYGTTACKWDTVIPFEPLWAQYKRLIKKRGAIVLFGSQPFTSALVMSNVEWFKYCWVWDKRHGANFSQANRRPLNNTEDIAIFYLRQCLYNPQKTKNPKGVEKRRQYKESKQKDVFVGQVATTQEYTGKSAKYEADMLLPKTIISFARPCKPVHPTQKPIALLEYLIRTYTNPGDTVLDNTMGSGTTMVACVHTGRNGVGIEMLPVEEDDPDYFGIAQGRVEHAQNEIVQLALI